jgi:DNA-directed RNA polymerase specialized sigma24 family protein
MKPRKAFDMTIKGYMTILHKRWGWTYKEIAEHLYCSVGTVRRYINEY